MEKYEIEQIVDTFVQTDDKKVTEIRYQGRNILKNILMNYLRA